MLGNEGLLPAPGLVEISLGDGTILQWRRREQVIRVTVLGDEMLRDYPEDLGPDFTDGVDAPVAGLVESFVRRRVNGLVLQKKRERLAGAKKEEVRVLTRE